MFERLLIFAALPILFYILPIKVSGKALMWLALSLWLIAGALLFSRALDYLLSSTQEAFWLVAVITALLLGIGKGLFVLSKTAKRNIARLKALTEKEKLIQVYALPSWIIIGVMMGLSLLLTVIGLAPMWRGSVLLAISVALLLSSLQYVKTLGGCKKADNHESPQA